MKRMTQRQAFLQFVGADEQKPAMSYGKRLAIAARKRAQVSTAPAGCVVPTKAGFDCEARLVEGEQYCGPHKRAVAKQVVAFLMGELR